MGFISGNSGWKGGTISSPKSGAAVAQLHTEVVGSPSLEVLQNHGDVALRDTVSGQCLLVVGGRMDWVILEVFPNLSNSVL